MILRKKYKSFAETMAYMKHQIVESMPFAVDYLPDDIRTAKGLWNFLKPRTTFVYDPPKTELLQSMQTLMSGQRTGITGGGDCDCFVITVTACANVLHLLPVEIILAGRSKKAPVHIYNRIMYDGEMYNFDLTEPLFGMERHYPYTQIIKANITF